ncbi:MAG: hypothetical protein UT65_C0019G0005 [Parcubacteria group bacterium GW2011_GWF2_39_8b]|nr:MAG: hypothetical protein UT65_C0019G0005 [Parcubacteria group bacterium GW2011_GWF2_39_8b]
MRMFFMLKKSKKYHILHELMSRWRNWQTRYLEVVVPKGLGVQVPLWTQNELCYNNYESHTAQNCRRTRRKTLARNHILIFPALSGVEVGEEKFLIIIKHYNLEKSYGKIIHNNFNYIFSSFVWSAFYRSSQSTRNIGSGPCFRYFRSDWCLVS